MRKKIYCFIVFVMILTAFSGCRKNEKPHISATEATEPSTVPTTEMTEKSTTEPTQNPTTEPTQQPTTEPTQNPTIETTEVTIPTEEPTNSNHSGLRDITDARITITEDKQVFNNLSTKLSLPLDWKCMEHVGEDGTVYYFRHPELGEKCQLIMSVTGSEYIYDRTKAEYFQYISSFTYDDSYEKNIKLDYYEKENFKGYRCIKAVYSYISYNTEYIRIHYDNVVIGLGMCDFLITYPASESETYKPLLESILDSVEFIDRDSTYLNDDYLLDVLHNKVPFVDETHKYVYLEDYKLGAKDGVTQDIPFVPQKYALIDLDKDGKNELILYIDSYYATYMVFRETYGFAFGLREMIDLKADGTFMQSSSAGINSVAFLSFDGPSYEFNVNAYKNDFDRVYKLGDTIVSVYAVKEYMDRFNNKQEPDWVEINPNG